MTHDQIKTEALDVGYPEELAEIVATVVMEREENITGYGYILDYPAFREGNFFASVGGELEIKADDVRDMTDAVNRLYQLGQPVTLIDGHNSETNLGTMPAAIIDSSGIMRAAIVAPWYVLDGILTGANGLSFEGMLNYNSEAYTGGKEYSYWPTAWAVLPVGMQPAIPPGEPLAAAEEENKPVRLYAQEATPEGGANPQRKGDAMTLEELTAKVETLEAAQTESAGKISALEAENGELKSKLEAAEKERDELKAAAEQKEAEAAEQAVEAKLAEMLEKKLPGKREGLKADVMAAEDLDARLSLIELLDKNVPDMTAEEQKLEAGEDGTSEKDSLDVAIEAAEERARKEHITYADALEIELGEKE